jgi:hypothetical protein
MWHIAGMPIVERNYALVVNSFFWTILAMIFIVMRLFTRAYIVKRVGMDDYLMVAAMVSSFLILLQWSGKSWSVFLSSLVYNKD